MIEKRTVRSIKNAMSGVINKLIGMLAPFLIRTILIQKLGVEYVGLNSLFSSVLQMLSLTELGFGSALIYSMYKPVACGDVSLARALLNYYKKIYRIIGSVIMVVGLILLPNIKFFIASDYPTDINIYLVYLLFLINTGVSYFLAAYKSSVLIANMRSDIENNIVTICNLVMYAVQIIVLVVTPNYYLYVIFLPIFTIVMNFARSAIVRRQYPEYFGNEKLSEENRKDILVRVKALVGHRIGGVVFSSVDTLVISSFLGLIVLGKYTNYYYIYTAVNGIIAIVFQSIIAVIGNSIAVKTEKENLKIFREFFMLNGWVACFTSCCFLCIYQPFIHMWLGSEFELSFSIVILLSIYNFWANIRRVETGFKDAAGMWQDDFWKPYVSVGVNLISNIILVKLIGLPGVIISSILALVFIEIPWEVNVLFNNYFKEKTNYFYIKLIMVIVVSVISALGAYYATKFIPYGMLGIVLRAVVCFIIATLIYILCFCKTEEFTALLIRFKSLRRKN